MWQALRERATRSQQYGIDIPDLDIDVTLLEALLGLKSVGKET
jgi:hypothetical protein